MCLTRPVNRLARQTSSGLLQSLKPQFRTNFWQAAACPPAPGLLSFSNCEMKHVLPSVRKASRLTPLPGRQNRHLFELVCRAVTQPSGCRISPISRLALRGDLAGLPGRSSKRIAVRKHRPVFVLRTTTRQPSLLLHGERRLVPEEGIEPPTNPDTSCRGCSTYRFLAWGCCD
jgi:hypothetical protein